MKKPGLIIEPGRPHPLGATPDENGVNFSVISVNATSVELLLFDHYNDVQPFATVLFHPVANRTFYFWHMHYDSRACFGALLVSLFANPILHGRHSRPRCEWCIRN